MTPEGGHAPSGAYGVDATPYRVSPQAIWTEGQDGDVFAGLAPNGPVVHLAGAGGDIFASIAESGSGLTLADLTEIFEPYAGLERGRLLEQITTFVQQLSERQLVVSVR